MSKNLNNNNLSFQGIKFINYKNKVNDNLLLNKQSKNLSLFKKFNNILAVLIITVLVIPLNLFAGLSNNMPVSDSLCNPYNGGFNRPFGIFLDAINHRFFATDLSNNRVLIYNLNNDNTFPDRTADYVLGYPSLDSCFPNNLNSSSVLNRPISLTYDYSNNYLFVGEITGNRIKVFDLSGGITNGMNASYVLGQPDFTSITANNTQNGLNDIIYIEFDSTDNRLFVAERAGNRVKVFDLSGGITNGMNASYVLGQPDFTSNTANNTQNGLNGVSGLKYDFTNQLLYVAEGAGNRVKVFDLSGGITNGMNASYVLGQPDFTSNTANNTQNGLNGPFSLDLDSTNNRLFVLERTPAHRVKIFDVTNIVDGENAINVLGQPDFTSNTANNTQNGLNAPLGIYFDTTTNRLFVSEDVHRIKIFDVTAITDGENAVDLLGQLDGSNNPIYTTANANNIQSVSATTFNDLASGELDLLNHRLFVGDRVNNRVLVFNLNSNNILVDKTPDYVLGQPDFVTNTVNHTQNGLANPYGLAYDSTTNRLFVAEQGAERVKVFDVSTIVNGENAINVIGQPDFTSSAGATTQSRLSDPLDIALDIDRQHLYVMDLSNNRVMIFDVGQSVLIPNVTNGPNAINVLGQSDYTSSATSVTANQLGGVNQNVTYVPSLDKIFVSSYTADRVLVFDVATIVDGENAVNVLGQPDFTTSGAGITQNTMTNPNKVVYDSVNKRLFIAEEGASRITVYDLSNGITNGMNASYVLGSPSFTSAGSLSLIHGLAFDEGNQRLYGFSHNSSIVIWDFKADLTTTTPILASVDTTPNYTFNTNEAGTITYGGSCSSATTVATVGNNTITLNQLSPGNYSNCTITITDNFGNISSTHTIPTFDIVVHSGGGSSSIPTPITTITESTINNTVTPPVLENTTTEVTTTVIPPTNTYTSPLDGTTKSCPAFTKYLRVGNRLNDSQEARLWQAFLNTKEEEKLTIDGIYGKQTESAIKRFQNKYKDFILSPWNLISPTGYTYKSTRAYANKLVNCSEGAVTLDNGKVINY